MDVLKNQRSLGQKETSEKRCLSLCSNNVQYKKCKEIIYCKPLYDQTDEHILLKSSIVVGGKVLHQVTKSFFQNSTKVNIIFGAS